MTALLDQVKGFGLIAVAAGICWRGATFDYLQRSGLPVIAVCLFAGLSLLALGLTVAKTTSIESAETDRGL